MASIDWAAGISGPVTISGWQSTGAEGDALTQTLCAAQAALPNLQITYQPIAGDYPAVEAANIAARTVPDLFYVNADYAQDWIDQTFLEQLDPYVQKSGFDVSHFFPGASSIFKAHGRHVVRLPQGHQHDRAWPTTRTWSPTRPTTLDELVAVGHRQQGQGRQQGAAVPQPGPRPRPRVPLRAGRLDRLR